MKEAAAKWSKKCDNCKKRTTEDKKKTTKFSHMLDGCDASMTHRLECGKECAEEGNEDCDAGALMNMIKRRKTGSKDEIHLGMRAVMAPCVEGKVRAC